MTRLIACILTLTSGAPAQVAVVVSQADGQVTRAGTQLPLSLRVGDLLYPGDEISPGGSEVALWHCPAGEQFVLPAQSKAVVLPAGLRFKSGSLAARAQLPSCELPRIDAVKGLGEKFVGVRLARTGTAAPGSGAAASPDPLAPVERLARAVTLEKAGLRAEAAAEFSRVAAAWTGVDWPRLLVHERQDDSRVLQPAGAAGMEPGKTYALVVGLSRYPRLKNEEQLKYADADARLLAEYLKSPRGGALPDDQVSLLVNERATTAAIRTEITTFLRARAGPNDSVIFFIAAHGIVDTRGAFLVTYDSDPEDLQTTALPMAEIQGLMEDEFSHAGNVLVYVDVCRAGTIGTIHGGDASRAVEILLRARRAKIFGVMASGPGEYSFEHERFGGGHGAFSYFLLRGLNGDADDDKDGKISSGELFEYVRAKVRESTLKRQTPRDLGDLPRDTVLIGDTRPPGIQLADWKPLENVIAQRRQAGPAPPPVVREGGEEPLEAARILPGTPGGLFELLERLRAEPSRSGDVLRLENRLRVALQDLGQQVLLRYLRGEAEPQRREDFDRGERYFRSALDLDPDAGALTSRALFCRGRALVFERRHREAIESLERAARLDPAGAYIFNALGIAYLELGDYHRAVLAFRDAVRLAPHWVYPVHNMALALTEDGDYVGAVAAYRKGIRLAPQAYYLHYNLGLVWERLNRRKDAAAALRQAAALAPESADAANAQGYLAASGGQRKPAEEFYRRALAKDPRHAAARHNLALLLAAESDRREEAIRLWRECIAEQPEFLPARFSLAETLAASDRSAEALAAYGAILEARPELISARVSLASLLLKSGRPAEAARELRIVLSEYPGRAELSEQLGDAEAAGGRRSEAAAAYRAAWQQARGRESRKRVERKLAGIGSSAR